MKNIFVVFASSLILISCNKQEGAPVEIKTELRRDYLATLGQEDKGDSKKRKVIDLDYDFLNDNDDSSSSKTTRNEKKKTKSEFVNEDFVHEEDDEVKKDEDKQQDDSKSELDSELKNIESSEDELKKDDDKEELKEGDDKDVALKDDEEEKKEEEKGINPVILEEAKEAAKPKKTAKKSSSSRGLITPAEGKVLVKFGDLVDGARSLGVDILSTLGSPVTASAKGIVVLVAKDSRFGNIVIVKHEETNLQTAYAYLSNVNVSKGQLVNPGEEIGTVGKKKGTGKPVLHFAVRKGNSPVDPLKYLK